MKIKLEKATKTALKAELKAIEQVLYIKGTCKIHKGNIHITKEGKVFTGLKHTDKCKRLSFRKTK